MLDHMDNLRLLPEFNELSECRIWANDLRKKSVLQEFNPLFDSEEIIDPFYISRHVPKEEYSKIYPENDRRIMEIPSITNPYTSGYTYDIIIAMNHAEIGKIVKKLWNSEEEEVKEISNDQKLSPNEFNALINAFDQPLVLYS